MIRLLKMTDKAGCVYEFGTAIVALENGCTVYENANNNSEAFIWVPERVRPYEYELRNMCNEEIADSEIKTNLLWPEKLLYDSGNHLCCGYVVKKPKISGEIDPLSKVIEKKRWFDDAEKKNNVFIGLQIARIFKSIRDTRHRYVLGVVSPESFWVDEASNVFFLESYNCARNLDISVKTYYIAPELLVHDSWKGKFTAETDSFIYALLLFQLLTGRFPYNSSQDVEKTDIEYIWNLMCDGESIYYDKTDALTKEVLEELKNYSEIIGQLFCRTFDYCGEVDYIEQRPTIDEWIEALSDYMGNM